MSAVRRRWPPNYGWNVLPQAANGTLQLARTNTITVYFNLPTAATNYTNWAGYNYAAGHEIQEAIEVGNGADNSDWHSQHFIPWRDQRIFY